MKSYAPNLLQAWPGDDSTEYLAASPRMNSLFADAADLICRELDWLVASVADFREREDEDIDDQMYRRGHICYGFASILRIPKLEHLLSILDFLLDSNRSDEVIQPRLDYLVQMLAASSRAVLEEFQKSGRCERNIGPEVEESLYYLQPSLESVQQSATAKSETRESERVVQTTSVTAEVAALEAAPETREAEQQQASSPPASPAAPPQEPSAAAPEIDDEPEILDIPGDKIGLISDFVEECRENLARIGHQLIVLEDSEAPGPLVNDLFRAMHTVKGGARLLKTRKLEVLAHQLEALLDQVRQGQRGIDARLIDLLLEGRQHLEQMIDEVASRGPVRTRVVPLLQAIAAFERGDLEPPASSPQSAEAGEEAPGAPETVVPEAAAPETAAPKTAAPEAVATKAPPPAAAERSGTALVSDSIRIPTDKLDDVLNVASEVFITRIRLQNEAGAITKGLRELGNTLQPLVRFDALSLLKRVAEANRGLGEELRALARSTHGEAPSEERLDSLLNRFQDQISAEFKGYALPPPEDITLNLLTLEDVRARLLRNVEDLEQLSSRLQNGAMSFRMIPIARLFDRFPLQVRDLARRLEKKVRLDIQGGETELDRVLIDHLADPLLHLLRNAVDHGIEAPEARRESGKPETGHILLRAYYQGSHAVIELSDDGRGIDTHRVLQKALDLGLVSDEEAAGLTPAEIFELLFHPRLTTAGSVTTVSGRGVGMDVVKTAINSIQGHVSIDSERRVGTTFQFKLPLTLAVISILLVAEGENRFAFPVLNVEEILTIKRDAIKRVGNSIVYNHRAKTLRLAMLSGILDFPPGPAIDDKLSVVVLSDGEKQLGILVDQVLGQQDVLIKNLGSLVQRLPLVMGCTILSDSRLVLILNPLEVINAQSGRVPAAAAEPDPHRLARRRRSVVVVEDSAIQRQRLGAILTQAGYRVELAENGFAGLKVARNRRQAAFCVDMVMPFMDGFEFIERLRQLDDYNEAPVFIITGQPGRQARDRASALGVAEFFVKPVQAEALVAALDRACLDESHRSAGDAPAYDSVVAATPKVGADA